MNDDFVEGDWGDLETFEAVGARLSSFVTITARKTISLSSGFLHKADRQIGNSEYVRLMYSKGKNAIVFDFTSDQNRNSIKLSRATNAQIAAASFFNYYRLDIKELEGRYEPELIDIPNVGEKWAIFLDKKQNAKSEEK